MNYGNLNEMINVAKELNADTLNFHHLIFTEENILKRHNELFKKYFGQESYDWGGFVLPSIKNIEVDKLIKIINNIKKGSYQFLVNFYPNFTDEEVKKYYKNPDFVSKTYPKRCLSPWVVAYVYPNGDVLPCHSLSYVVGNIKDKPFKDIWNGSKFCEFRQILREEKCFPICPKCTEKYRY